MLNDFASEEDLLDRLTAQSDRVVFLVGSAVTAPVRVGEPGVPRVDGVIEQVRRVYTRADALARFEQALAKVPPQRYQTAFRHLHCTRGQDLANAIIRRCVLQARVPSSRFPEVHQDIPEGASDLCRTLEQDLEGWHLPPAAEALGQLLANRHAGLRQVLLTSNFDPLMTVSVNRAGGQAFTTTLHNDGGFAAIDGEGTLIVHFHGDWFRSDTLHTPTQLGQDRPRLAASLSQLLSASTLVVLGYGGGDDIFTRSLVQVIRGELATIDVLWTFYCADSTRIAERYAGLLATLSPGISRGRIVLYKGINAHTFLPRLMLARETAKAKIQEVQGRAEATAGNSRRAPRSPPTSDLLGTGTAAIKFPTAWPPVPGAPPDASSPFTVLLVSASPDSRVRLRVDKEFRDIISRVRGSRLRDRFNFVQIQAARYDEMITALQEHEPQVLHISAHGKPDGSLVFEGEQAPQEVSKAQLLRLLTALRDKLRIVVLNACDSHAVAQAIPSVLDLAIGMTTQIGDRAAIDFSVAFYESLGFGKPVETAFNVALAALEDIEHETPKLFPPASEDPYGRRQLLLVTKQSRQVTERRSAPITKTDKALQFLSAGDAPAVLRAVQMPGRKLNFYPHDLPRDLAGRFKSEPEVRAIIDHAGEIVQSVFPRFTNLPSAEAVPWRDMVDTWSSLLRDAAALSPQAFAAVLLASQSRRDAPIESIQATLRMLLPPDVRK